MKVTLTAIDENGKEVRYVTQARIMLNTEFPRYRMSSPRERKSRANAASPCCWCWSASRCLALVAQEVRYNSMVELRLATNQRDELRAHYMAKSSGIGMSRLMLRFQKQLNGMQIPGLGAMMGPLSQLLGGGGGAAGGASALTGLAGALGGGGAAGANPLAQYVSIQLWRMVTIDCYMLHGVSPSEEPSGGVGPEERQEVRIRRREPRARRKAEAAPSSAASPAASTPSSSTKKSGST